MMRSYTVFTVIVVLCILPFSKTVAQCSLTDATSCVCRTAGQNTCELLPDLTISWVGLEIYASGPTEYSQSHSSQPGRLRVSGSTPNIGYGPLEVRTADVLNRRHFVCGTDTFTVTGGQGGFSCPNGQEPKQIIFQQVYNKQGNNMSRVERMAGSMTYHSAHSHYHVNDWTTMNLCLEDPNEPDPRKWPVVASGAKIGFCLMDFGACSSYPGHCRTSQEYGGGTAMNGSDNYPNYGLSGSYGCGSNVQGISVGRTDIYSKSLDMMWINIMDGLCNGNYWIVAEVDPNNVFMEENDDNNWTAIPFAISLQRPAGSGGSAGIIAPQGLVASPGAPVTLTATPGYSYQWSNGATTRSIEVDQPGNYSVTVTAPCGSLASAPVTVTAIPAPAAPTGIGAEVLGPAMADLAAVGEGTIVWYDAAADGQELATGASYTTPMLEESTTYYAASRTTVAGQNMFAAKTDLSGTQNSFNGKQWLFFDAYEPFELVSVKVYATGNGDRHFALVDNVGNLIEERYIYVPNGTHRVDLNMQVPAGTGHRITAFDDNTEIIQQLHRDNSGVNYPYALGTLGAITSSSAGSGFYYFLYDWEVRTPDVVMESSRTPVVAEVTDGVQVDLRVFLQGPYDAQSGLMTEHLRTSGLLPLVEPYTAMGFPQVAGGGGESAAASMFNVAGNDAIVDWVRLELRDASDPTQVVASAHGLLTRSGQVRSVTGTAVRFAVPNGNYHVAVRHRNHLGCMTAAPAALNATPLVLDITSSGTPVWGSNARNSSGGVQLLWSGNVVPDNKLKYTGTNNDRDPILTAIGGAGPTNTVSGYLGLDVNMDGLVKYTGVDNDRDPILTNVGGLIPTNVRSEQLP